MIHEPSETRRSSRCHACELARAETTGAMCVMHETSTSAPRGKLRGDDGQRGPIGPVPVVAFSYVTGDVPTFDDAGRRVI